MSDRLDELTPRERDTFELLRLGLTNEEIADRLGITLDGAKYHVSQILSKLGVSSREEAAAVALHPYPTRRWLSLPIAVQVTAAALAAGIIALVAILSFGTLRSGSGNAELTPEEVVSHIAGAMDHDGQVLHSKVQSDHPPSPLVGPTVTEYWVDPSLKAIRVNYTATALPPEQRVGAVAAILVVDRAVYMMPYQSTQPTTLEQGWYGDTCPGSNAPWLAIFLRCRGGGPSLPSDLGLPDPRFKWTVSVESAQYSGQDALVLAFTTAPPSVTPEPPATARPGGVKRLHIDPTTYLPLGSQDSTLVGDQEVDSSSATYSNEFVPRTTDAMALFDPANIGYDPSATPALPSFTVLPTPIAAR